MLHCPMPPICSPFTGELICSFTHQVWHFLHATHQLTTIPQPPMPTIPNVPNTNNAPNAANAMIDEYIPFGQDYAKRKK